MRRTTVHKTPVGQRRRRAHGEALEADEPMERPEVRRDIRRIWWPDAADDVSRP
ncbi:hypothetical protein [Streptomyces odontomachi]|uniref:hypothetical protein n=1 Tax=Streptomyces odontomachi TaxID=2944940 RepID=UPI00210E14F7|nr:hypothetical protein [Streptomyces sp. ODS25]